MDKRWLILIATSVLTALWWSSSTLATKLRSANPQTGPLERWCGNSIYLIVALPDIGTSSRLAR